MNHEERACLALEGIATALTEWVKIEAQRFEKEYPPKREPREALVTYIPTEEEELQRDQGASGESQDEWIGLREREVLEQSSKKSPAQPRGSSKRISPQSPKGKRG